ncbi:OmpH family outer membrane protein, partial [Vibrio parahaemolyticus]|nr:OmpH family outer membrane protein [Vibrio parahaemolyticus]
MVSFVVDDVRKKQIEAVNNAVQVNTVSYELKLKQLEEKYESKLKALESENDELRKLFDNADYYLELESKFDDVNDKMFEVSKIATEKGYSGILDAVNSLIEIDITDNEKVALSDSIDLVDNNHAGGCVNSLDIIINHKLDANKPPAELFDDKCQQCNSGVINTHELL